MTISLPLNFGLHLLDSPTHSNITLATSEGETARASSVILALNSPVMDHMTSELHLTSIDMKEFSKEAVMVFIKALYSGDTTSISRQTFRDVNKMAHVFEVCWLVARCEEVFKEIADKMLVPCWPDLLFLFEEAAFIISKRKCYKLKEIALKRIQALKWEQDFIKWYDEYERDIPTHKLDMITELAGTQVECIVLPINR